MAIPTATRSAVVRTVQRDPKCPIITPDIGSAMTEPAAIANNTRPNSEGSRWSRSRTWGMRDAQLAPEKPIRMKAA